MKGVLNSASQANNKTRTHTQTHKQTDEEKRKRTKIINPSNKQTQTMTPKKMNNSK